MKKNTVDILDVHFSNITFSETIHILTNRLREQTKTFVVTANPEIVMQSLDNREYKETLDNADFIIPDGIGIIKAASMLNQPLPERIPGFELMVGLLQVAQQNQFKIFLLGSKDEVLDKVVSYINEHYPAATIVGKHHGFFDFTENVVNEQIIQAEPDLIFVAMGVPKQELWISKNIHKFDKGLFMGIGGSFDVLAGTVKRAPILWQKLNVEWLYRLLQQPWRWKRMLALPKFVFKVLQQKLR